MTERLRTRPATGLRFLEHSLRGLMWSAGREDIDSASPSGSELVLMPTSIDHLARQSPSSTLRIRPWLKDMLSGRLCIDLK